MIKNNGLIFLLIVVLFSFTLSSQVPVIQWQKTYGGTLDDGAYSILTLTDSSFIIVGFASSDDGDVVGHHNPSPGFDSKDMWIVKLDNEGSILWNKCYGGTSDEEATSVVNTSDSGFILTGFANSDDGDVVGQHGRSIDGWIVKTDYLGTIQWQKCLGSTQAEFAYQIINTRDSGYIVIGETSGFDGDLSGANYHGNGDVCVFKISQNGVLQWAKSYGGSLPDGGNSIQETSDGGYLIAGATTSNDGDVTGFHNSNAGDVWVIKIDSLGVIEWQKCYGGTGNDFAYQLNVTPDGGAVILGSTTSNDGDVTNFYGGYDVWLIRIDSLGIIIYEKCFGGINFELGKAISSASDGGFVLIADVFSDDGMVNGTHGLFDYWICKIDSLGNFEWGKALGGADDDESFAIKECLDGGLIVAGLTSSLNSGDVTSNHGGKDFWVVKLSAPGLSVSEVDRVFMELNVFQINDQVMLRFFSRKNLEANLSIYNMNGGIISSNNICANEGVNYIDFAVTDFASGLYFLNLGGARLKFIIN